MCKFRALVQSFPALNNPAYNHAPTPLLLSELRHVVNSGAGAGAVHAALFCLFVYFGDTSKAEQGGDRFNLYWAWGHWDSAQRRAWKAWAVDPWWC